MSPVYRIVEEAKDRYVVQKRWKLLWLIPIWHDVRGRDDLPSSERYIKESLPRDVFKWRVVSVWSVKGEIKK